MSGIENIGKIAVTEEIKAIDPSEKSLFYEENFNSLLQEELAKKNAKKQQSKKQNDNNSDDESSDNHDAQHDDQQKFNANNHYDEKLDNSKNNAVITTLNDNNKTPKNNYKAVFITLSHTKESIIPIHKNKRFLTILTKIMKKIGKSIKNMSKNCF